MKNKPFRMICLGLAAAFILGISGCSPAGSNPGGSNGPGAADGNKKDTVVIASKSEPPTLDTMNQNWMMTCVSTLLTHNCLVRVGDGLEPEPDLAESYEAVSDTEWIFKLREGVKFHDGTEMTAEDVKATLEKAATVSQAQQYVEKIASVEVVDPYTVKITTDGPCSSLLVDLTNQQVAILSKKDIDANVDFSTHVNGTGPYKFVSYTAGDKLEYEANEDYFDKDEAPAIKHMIWRFIPEGAARTIALEAGNIDYAYDLATVDVPKLEKNPDVEVLRQDSVALLYLMLNTEKEPFDNPLFRKAIAAAIDRDSIVKVTMNGFANSAISCAPPGFSSSTTENAVGYDLEKAKEYLEQSGVDPSTVKMPIVCSTDENMRTGAVIQANLAELGIEVELVSMDHATWLASYNSGDFTAGITQLAQRSMQQWLTTIYHSRYIGATNGSRLNDSKVDEYLDQAAVTIDPTENQQILTDCVARLNDLCPVVPLYSNVYVKAYNSGLGGANCNATGAAYYHWLYWK
ncbi:MAG: ABC transporter substrate-binding protein [Clostridiales bacterium]|nr:ABC transporter substrate-binding protein [Clostridiales bacterium]